MERKFLFAIAICIAFQGIHGESLKSSSEDSSLVDLAQKLDAVHTSAEARIRSEAIKSYKKILEDVKNAYENADDRADFKCISNALREAIEKMGRAITDGVKCIGVLPQYLNQNTNSGNAHGQEISQQHAHVLLKYSRTTIAECGRQFGRKVERIAREFARRIQECLRKSLHTSHGIQEGQYEIEVSHGEEPTSFLTNEGVPNDTLEA